jgi:hypothetical protein
MAQSTEVIQSGAGLSEGQRVVDAFVAPTKTFTDILRNASWWVPFLLACVMSVAGAYTIDRQVGYERVVQNVLHETPKQEEQMASLKPEDRAARLNGMAKGYRYTSYASPVFVLAIAAIGSLALWGTFNFGLGARTTYKQMFAVWMYASLPRLLTGPLMIVTVTFGGDPESFNLKNPVGTNPAYYFPDLSPGLKAGLAFADVIGLWVVALLILGTSIVAGVSRGKAAAAVLGWWLLILLLSTGAAAAFS